MAAAPGGTVPYNNYFGGPTPPPVSPLANQYKLYNSGVAQNAGDYDSIMNAYRQFLSQSQGQVPQTQYNPVQMPAGINRPKPITVQANQYAPSADVTKSLSNLGNLAETGGYSPEDVSNIRERGISPIRSIYANAQQEMARKRAIQGGYSPNFNASSAKMAREMSDLVAGKTTDVNAQLAQQIAQGKLSAAQPYAAASAQENAARMANEQQNAQLATEIAKYNSTGQMETDRFNSDLAARIAQANQQGQLQTNALNQQGRLASQGNQLGAIEGMRGLYGTTPAMASLFGNQALGAAQLQSQNKLAGNRNLADIFGSSVKGWG